MKKVFGVQAEFNITADEDIVKGMGKDIASCNGTLRELFKELKPEIIKIIKKSLTEEKKDEQKTK